MLIFAVCFCGAVQMQWSRLGADTTRQSPGVHISCRYNLSCIHLIHKTRSDTLGFVDPFVRRTRYLRPALRRPVARLSVTCGGADRQVARRTTVPGRGGSQHQRAAVPYELLRLLSRTSGSSSSSFGANPATAAGVQRRAPGQSQQAKRQILGVSTCLLTTRSYGYMHRLVSTSHQGRAGISKAGFHALSGCVETLLSRQLSSGRTSVVSFTAAVLTVKRCKALRSSCRPLSRRAWGEAAACSAFSHSQHQ